MPESSHQPAADSAAFTALVDRHGRFLYRVAFNLLKNPQDAEDAVQETLLKLFRADSWRNMQDERAFLAAAVWRVGLNRLDSAAARHMRHAADVTEMPLRSSAPSPEHMLADSEQRQTMRDLMNALPEALRQPLILSAIQGMKSHEVAAILDIPEGTVRTRIMRAKAELRVQFMAATARPREVRA